MQPIVPVQPGQSTPLLAQPPVRHPLLRGWLPVGMGWAGLPLAVLLVLLAWQSLVMMAGYQPYTLPSPLLVAQRFGTAASSGVLLHHTLSTLAAALGGFALALVVGLVLGYLLFQLDWLERSVAPLLATTQAIPIVAVAPLIILWFGTGVQAKVLVAALITFFPILMSTLVALRQIPRELREMALISGASRWQMLCYVEFPLALPVLFGGLRSGLALATTGAVVGEFVSGRDGLGALINIARGLFDTPLMFVAILTLAGLTLAFYVLLNQVERMVIRWSD